MTAAETRPQPIVQAEPEPEPEERPERLRPLDRRILQALALICAVPAFLALQWVDETNGIQKNLKPPEKVTSVQPGQVGEMLGAQWKEIGRQQAPPLAKDDLNDVVDLRVGVAVRPRDAASAKSVGSYGIVYRLVDGEGREWSAMATSPGAPRAGVAMRIVVKGTVPRAKADSLELVIQAPKTSRKGEDPLPSLRFEH
ncbi:hypothetical protein E1287_26360 [Actinomadura sp. KC06]|uniref:hypothetical protein n=1 Tax=Actinomadura sp. KC06 TaxID=2530369 RepID=UPI00104439B7|nr:hypothetical protein [Actinomadura sp. KC06]TDD31443.1 hypothetical protein E1287_26360 [Actinomadura sp. KC06]